MKKLLTLFLAALMAAPMMAEGTTEKAAIVNTESKSAYYKLIGTWQTDWKFNNDDDINKTAKISLTFLGNKEGGILLDITGSGEKNGKDVNIKAQFTLDCTWAEDGEILRAGVKANTAKFSFLEMNVDGTDTLPLIGEEGLKQMNNIMMQQMIKQGLLDELSSRLVITNINFTSPTTLTCIVHDDELTFTRK